MIRAIHFPDKRKFREAKLPGSFFVQSDSTVVSSQFFYFCPCGCSIQSVLKIGNKFKPGGNQSWNWNGSTTEPTLSPSVNHVDHWHGWLREGYWWLA
jgi:Family of unknown function (DUF6527)